MIRRESMTRRKCERCGERSAEVYQADATRGAMLIRTDLGSRWCQPCGSHVSEYHAQSIGWSLGKVCDGQGNERTPECSMCRCSCPQDWTFRFGTDPRYVHSACAEAVCS